MAILNVQTIDRAGDGLTPAMSAAAAGGDEFVNTGREFIIVRTAGTATVVTAATPQTVSGLPVGDETYTLPATGERLVGPFPVGTFNNQTTGRVALTYTAVTGVTLGVFKVG